MSGVGGFSWGVDPNDVPKEGSSGVVPHNTLAKVVMTIQPPNAERKQVPHPSDGNLTVSENGAMYYQAVFSVVWTETDSHVNKKIFENIGFESGPDAQARAKANGKDHHAWKKMGMRFLAQALCAAKGIPYNEENKTGALNHIAQSGGSPGFSGIEFPVVIKVRNAKDQNGNEKQENTVMDSVVGCEDPRWSVAMGRPSHAAFGGHVPQAQAQAPQTQPQNGGWSNHNPAQGQPQTAAQQPQGGNGGTAPGFSAAPSGGAAQGGWSTPHNQGVPHGQGAQQSAPNMGGWAN